MIGCEDRGWEGAAGRASVRFPSPRLPAVFREVGTPTPFSGTQSAQSEALHECCGEAWPRRAGARRGARGGWVRAPRSGRPESVAGVVGEGGRAARDPSELERGAPSAARRPAARPLRIWGRHRLPSLLRPLSAACPRLHATGRGFGPLRGSPGPAAASRIRGAGVPDRLLSGRTPTGARETQLGHRGPGLSAPRQTDARAGVGSPATPGPPAGVNCN
ncbi:uncharacterized protein LOC101549434 [Sorex araneus]|uniref:uncharacterized protein LOC101549434 n=1 Tax=Sorex araneus TaxID=42254 RepID=UPI002433B50C|nr:uncharacterized protein LOC101549434 [Sorex araneus]